MSYYDITNLLIAFTCAVLSTAIWHEIFSQFSARIEQLLKKYPQLETKSDQEECFISVGKYGLASLIFSVGYLFIISFTAFFFLVRTFIP